MKKLPVGVSDFKDMITGDYYYVDKTLFIKEILDKGDKILLIPRPRRFGKTLNLSMLKYFYDCCPDVSSPGTGGKPGPAAKGAKSEKCSIYFTSSRMFPRIKKWKGIARQCQPEEPR